MAFSIEDSTIIQAVLILLVLSIATIEFCRRDKLNLRNIDDQFLFRGKSFKHSLVSNVGAIFSVTYFFGATFIYAALLNVWAIISMTLGFILGFYLITRVFKAITKTLDINESTANRANVLLQYINKTSSNYDYKLFVQALGIIYFSLLVEEIAVSRLVLNTLFPSHLAVTVLLLTIISIVIFAYLSLGGFRAVLISDLVQGFVLSAFVLMLIFLMAKNHASVSSNISNSWSGYQTPLSSVFFGLLLVVWLIVSVDSYSRLNFESKTNLAWKYRYRLVYLSLITTFFVVIIGMVFAIFASTDIGPIVTPSLYTKETLNYFFQNRIPAVKIILLVGLFCMIFTTIDTLLLTVLQLGFHVKSKLVSRKNMSTVLLASVIFASIMPGDAVSAVGIFIASLLIIPCSAVLRAVIPIFKILLPSTNRYFIPSALIALAVFIANYSHLETNFRSHYQIPIIVSTSLIVSVVGWKVSKYIKFIWGKNVN